MQTAAFLQNVDTEVRSRLPNHLASVKTRRFGSLIKLYYHEPAIHYEVWIRRREGLIELGLHFEGPAPRNADLLRYFSHRADEVLARLGPRVELEQWTASWGRLHETIPYQSLDDELLQQVVDRLAAYMTTLQPMLEEERHDG